MTDGDVTSERLAALSQYVRTLEGFGHADSADLESNVERRWAVLHGLQLAIECVQDVAAHLAASGLLGKPTSHAEAIDLLGEHGVIPVELAARIRGMAGFRNVIVHEYVRVDLDRVADSLRHLDDFKEFVAAVSSYLETKDS